ncbi:heavy-metal-associated domain-containing protein [Wenyingzhuangia sp. 1_MG-2023]|nr:heavy-metal-associated domain-containing protein [Wenyingzhuangia sp. 1_MG-2023]
MKKGILSIAVVAILALAGCKEGVKSEKKVTSIVSQHGELATLNFGVRGNCAMCKQTIEKAVNGVEGVASANWDVNEKKIEVVLDPTITNEMAIHNAIAASGYDTEKVTASGEAYTELPGCCQYDHEMEMGI